MVPPDRPPESASEAGDPGMDTPLAPMPAPARSAKRARAAAPTKPSRREKRREKKDAGGPELPAGPIKLGYRFAGGLSFRVLPFVVVVQLLLALTVVLPFWHGVSEQLDYNPHAAALAGSPTAADTALGWDAGLHPGVWKDVQTELEGLFSGLTIVHFWVAILAWLFGAVAAGGFLGLAVSGEKPRRVGAFLAHGGRWFGRMLRVGLVFGIFYYLAARLVFEAWGGGIESSEFSDPSEASGWFGERARELVLVLCFFWFRIAADWARADLVISDRHSALGAFFRGLGNALRPRTMLTALAFGAPALLLLLGLGFAAQELTGDGTLTLVLLFLVYQLAVALRWAARAGVLAAFAEKIRGRRVKTR